MTTPLFHGPEARDRAFSHSMVLGRPLRDPIGDQGLKISEAREIIILSRNSGIGDRPPTLVVGPMDTATPSAADALLKTLEESSRSPLRIILWADFLGGVLPTILSRTHHIWSPPGPCYIHPLSYLEDQAEILTQAILSGDPFKIMSGLGKIGKGDFKTQHKDWSDLLEAVSLQLPGHLGGDHDERILQAWEGIKDALNTPRGSFLLAVDALLPLDLGGSK